MNASAYALARVNLPSHFPRIMPVQIMRKNANALKIPNQKVIGPVKSLSETKNELTDGMEEVEYVSASSSASATMFQKNIT